MSNESIFNEATTSTEEVVTNPASQDIELPPEVTEFVGEGKKYKTLQDALKSIPHAQSHIQKLEEELAEARTEKAKSDALDELLEEIKKQNNNQGDVTKTTVQNPPVSSLDIDKRVEAALARKEAQIKAEANKQAVIAAFEQAYGSEGEAYYVKLASENGMPLATLNQLAVTSPEAILKLAGIKKVQGTIPKTTSTVKTEAVTDTGNSEMSAKVKMVGASTKEVLNAWQNAKQKALNKLNA